MSLLCQLSQPLSALLAAATLELVAAGQQRELLAGEVEPTPTITILVFNNAPAPDDLLDAAEREAESIFSRAGVRVNWCDCSMGHADATSQGTCQEGWGEINSAEDTCVNRPKDPPHRL
jgi:hypothetical protein